MAVPIAAPAQATDAKAVPRHPPAGWSALPSRVELEAALVAAVGVELPAVTPRPLLALMVAYSWQPARHTWLLRGSNTHELGRKPVGGDAHRVDSVVFARFSPDTLDAIASRAALLATAHGHAECGPTPTLQPAALSTAFLDTSQQPAFVTDVTPLGAGSGDDDALGAGGAAAGAGCFAVGLEGKSWVGVYDTWAPLTRPATHVIEQINDTPAVATDAPYRTWHVATTTRVTITTPAGNPSPVASLHAHDGREVASMAWLHRPPAVLGGAYALGPAVTQQTARDEQNIEMHDLYTNRDRDDFSERNPNDLPPAARATRLPDLPVGRHGLLLTGGGDGNVLVWALNAADRAVRRAQFLCEPNPAAVAAAHAASADTKAASPPAGTAAAAAEVTALINLYAAEAPLRLRLADPEAAWDMAQNKQLPPPPPGPGGAVVARYANRHAIAERYYTTAGPLFGLGHWGMECEPWRADYPLARGCSVVGVLRGAHGNDVLWLQPVSDPVTGVQRWLVTSSSDSTLKVWDLNTMTLHSCVSDSDNVYHARGNRLALPHVRCNYALPVPARHPQGANPELRHFNPAARAVADQRWADVMPGVVALCDNDGHVQLRDARGVVQYVLDVPASDDVFGPSKRVHDRTCERDNEHALAAARAARDGGADTKAAAAAHTVADSAKQSPKTAPNGKPHKADKKPAAKAPEAPACPPLAPEALRQSHAPYGAAKAKGPAKAPAKGQIYDRGVGVELVALQPRPGVCYVVCCTIRGQLLAWDLSPYIAAAAGASPAAAAGAGAATAGGAGAAGAAGAAGPVHVQCAAALYVASQSVRLFPLSSGAPGTASAGADHLGGVFGMMQRTGGGGSCDGTNTGGSDNVLSVWTLHATSAADEYLTVADCPGGTLVFEAVARVRMACSVPVGVNVTTAL